MRLRVGSASSRNRSSRELRTAHFHHGGESLQHLMAVGSALVSLLGAGPTWLSDAGEPVVAEGDARTRRYRGQRNEQPGGMLPARVFFEPRQDQAALVDELQHGTADPGLFVGAEHP